MKNRYATLICLALVCPSALAHPPWTEIDPGKGCKSNPEVVSACYLVRGRIFIANGGYPFRIWPVGSKRYLAILPAEAPVAPKNILNKLSYDDGVFSEVYADLEVCPFTRQRPGVMQFVCIESAKHVRVSRGQ
jgi:hypothetical protein